MAIYKYIVSTLVCVCVCKCAIGPRRSVNEKPTQGDRIYNNFQVNSHVKWMVIKKLFTKKSNDRYIFTDVHYSISDKTICDDEVISPQMIPQMHPITPTTVVSNRIQSLSPKYTTPRVENMLISSKNQIADKNYL